MAEEVPAADPPPRASTDAQTGRPRALTRRLRAASVAAADKLWNLNPQPGMWAATGTAIAYAPNLTELREPVAGGENIVFNEHGHSSRIVTTDARGQPVLLKGDTGLEGVVDEKAGKEVRPGLERQPALLEQAQVEEHEKHTWLQTIGHGFKAFYKFASTPTGFLMTVYGLNIVAWGAMLFFLLLGAAPAMNHPSKDAINSPRKIWIEIDSQILNALFCVTGFGLAPWRFRDLWWLIQARIKHNKYAMERLNEQNRAWFRPPQWYTSSEEENAQDMENGPGQKRITFTGEVAPPTKIWKLSFVIWMMVLNTLFQACLAGFMWGYNRINRPTWSTGMFIGLGCGVSLLAGLMMWWEGRKVKKIEGPMIKVVETHKSHRLLR